MARPRHAHPRGGLQMARTRWRLPDRLPLCRGGEWLAEALQDHDTLRLVDLRGNAIGDVAVGFLLQLACPGPSLFPSPPWDAPPPRSPRPAHIIVTASVHLFAPPPRRQSPVKQGRPAISVPPPPLWHTPGHSKVGRHFWFPWQPTQGGCSKAALPPRPPPPHVGGRHGDAGQRRTGGPPRGAAAGQPGGRCSAVRRAPCGSPERWGCDADQPEWA